MAMEIYKAHRIEIVAVQTERGGWSTRYSVAEVRDGEWREICSGLIFSTEQDANVAASRCAREWIDAKTARFRAARWGRRSLRRVGSSA